MENSPKSGFRSPRSIPKYGMASIPKKDQERSRQRNLSGNPWVAASTQNPAAQKATGIENKLRYALLRKGINFIEQASIGPWSIDFLLPDYMACVEADGEYWHSSTKARMKDRRKDAWLQNKGYTVFHFDGKEIIQDADYCVNRLMQSLEKKIENIAKQVYSMIEEEDIQMEIEENKEDFPAIPEEIAENPADDYDAWVSGGFSFGGKT